MSEAGRDRTWTQASLKHLASDDAVTGTCRVCAKPIAQALSSAAREAYCCEGCILAERKRRELAAVVELTALIAYQSMSSRFNAALGVPAAGFCQSAQAAESR